MMEAGLITPPMGLNVFTVAAIAKDTSLEEIFKGALPFLIGDAIKACVVVILARAMRPMLNRQVTD
jgi:TRAP-type C4-dicarboxylate transport system permease large subunit